ncbi:hypothetical protein Tco_0997262 [Tanacetum coccineum]
MRSPEETGGCGKIISGSSNRTTRASADKLGYGPCGVGGRWLVRKGLCVPRVCVLSGNGVKPERGGIVSMRVRRLQSSWEGRLQGSTRGWAAGPPGGCLRFRLGGGSRKGVFGGCARGIGGSLWLAFQVPLEVALRSASPRRLMEPGEGVHAIRESDPLGVMIGEGGEGDALDEGSCV